MACLFLDKVFPVSKRPAEVCDRALVDICWNTEIVRLKFLSS